MNGGPCWWFQSLRTGNRRPESRRHLWVYREFTVTLDNTVKHSLKKSRVMDVAHGYRVCQMCKVLNSIPNTIPPIPKNMFLKKKNYKLYVPFKNIHKIKNFIMTKNTSAVARLGRGYDWKMTTSQVMFRDDGIDYFLSGVMFTKKITFMIKISQKYTQK